MFPNSNILRGIVQDKINPNILKMLFYFYYLLGSFPILSSRER